MRIEFNPALLYTHKVSGTKLNISNRINFENSVPSDSFQHMTVERYFDENLVRAMVIQNAGVKDVLDRYLLPSKLNITELKDLKDNHLRTTQNIAFRIVDNLPTALKERVNEKDLRDGAILHDYGKVLVPAEILNKKGKLNPYEYKIMQLHSELGYQLLKNTGINDNVLNLIRNHHNNLDKNKKFIPDVNLQVLNLADKYSALTEKRVYKPAMSPQQALTILAKEVDDGKVHPLIFNALAKSISSNPFANTQTHFENYILKAS